MALLYVIVFKILETSVLGNYLLTVKKLCSIHQYNLKGSASKNFKRILFNWKISFPLSLFETFRPFTKGDPWWKFSNWRLECFLPIVGYAQSRPIVLAKSCLRATLVTHFIGGKFSARLQILFWRLTVKQHFIQFWTVQHITLLMQS